MEILYECNELTKTQSNEFVEQKITVLNNIGCAYRRIGRLKKAVYYLDEALKLILLDKIESWAGITYLNLCAVYSQMGRLFLKLKFLVDY